MAVAIVALAAVLVMAAAKPGTASASTSARTSAAAPSQTLRCEGERADRCVWLHIESGGISTAGTVDNRVTWPVYVDVAALVLQRLDSTWTTIDTVGPVSGLNSVSAFGNRRTCQANRSYRAVLFWRWHGQSPPANGWVISGTHTC